MHIPEGAQVTRPGVVHRWSRRGCDGDWSQSLLVSPLSTLKAQVRASSHDHASNPPLLSVPRGSKRRHAERATGRSIAPRWIPTDSWKESIEPDFPVLFRNGMHPLGNCPEKILLLRVPSEGIPRFL